MSELAMEKLRIPGPSSNAKLRPIKEIQFGIFSPEEIKGFSVAHIQFPEVMDEANRGRPRPEGLGDPRLGSIDRNFQCATCGMGPQDCQGHFGHIELAMPVFHPGKTPYTSLGSYMLTILGFIIKVKKLLECVCHNCGKILVDEVCFALYHDRFDR